MFAALLWLAFYAACRVDERYIKRAALAARADQQHGWVLAGDDRGVCRDYPPQVPARQRNPTDPMGCNLATEFSQPNRE
jgi:hypothetical protein